MNEHDYATPVNEHLALSRSIATEGQALRTYLLVGGEGGAFSDTLQTLQTNRFDLRWSSAGRQGSTPGPRDISLRRFMARNLRKKALASQLSWGKHFRTPPKCWAALRSSVRQTWLRTADTARWRVILWELNHRGTENTDEIDWVAEKAAWSFAC